MKDNSIHDHEAKSDKPRITGVVDLSHFNQRQRVRLVGGSKRWLSRLDFLRQTFGSAALVVLPPWLASSCNVIIDDVSVDNETKDASTTPNQTSENNGPEQDNASEQPDSSGTSDNNVEQPNSDTSQTNETSNQDSESIAQPPRVFDVYPQEPTLGYYEDVNVRIFFDKKMDFDSLRKAFSIDPQPTQEFNLDIYSYASESASGFTTGLGIESLSNFLGTIDLEPNTTYSLQVRGDIAKDENGLFLDGNNDGQSGDDYRYSFTTGNVADQTDACSCHADYGCSSDSISSCSTDSCTCVSFTCSCQFASCVTYGTGVY